MTAASVRNRARDLEQKVALVTGGAHGLGRHTCRGLAWAGARVVVVDIDERGGDAVAGAVGGAFVAADLSRSDANHEVVAAAMEQYGRLDLVHLGPSTTAEPMSAMVDRVMYGTQAALPAFEATGDGGAIVAAPIGASRALTDVASNHALIGLARALAAILAPRQVRFNAVLPDARACIAEAMRVDDPCDKLVRTVDSANAGDAVVALLAGETNGNAGSCAAPATTRSDRRLRCAPVRMRDRISAWLGRGARSSSSRSLPTQRWRRRFTAWRTCSKTRWTRSRRT